MYANDERGECVINSGSNIWHQVAAAVTNAKITQKSVLTHTFSAKRDKRTSHMPHATWVCVCVLTCHLIYARAAKLTAKRVSLTYLWFLVNFNSISLRVELTSVNAFAYARGSTTPADAGQRRHLRYASYPAAVGVAPRATFIIIVVVNCMHIIFTWFTSSALARIWSNL